MPVYQLGQQVAFPPVDHAEDGLLAVGGDLRPERLILAYSMGIFPWYSKAEPILWYSPDPRMVLTPDRLRVSRSLRKALRGETFRITMDQRFTDVVEACARVPRPGEEGTWITADMKKAYWRLNRDGLAHSVEAWHGAELVGGLYGVSLGAAFFGESMFSKASDASKCAFVALVEQLARWNMSLVDCQVYSEHLERFGAEEWPRKRFLEVLGQALESRTRQGVWTFDGV